MNIILVCCFDTGHVSDHVLVQHLFSVPKWTKTKNRDYYHDIKWKARVRGSGMAGNIWIEVYSKLHVSNKLYWGWMCRLLRLLTSKEHRKNETKWFNHIQSIIIVEECEQIALLFECRCWHFFRLSIRIKFLRMKWRN